MDIVFDPPGSGLFSEVYLYEELMEADLHAIVGTQPLLFRAVLTTDPFWSTAIRCALPIIPVSDAVWAQGEYTKPFPSPLLPPKS